MTAGIPCKFLQVSLQAAKQKGWLLSWGSAPGRDVQLPRDGWGASAERSAGTDPEK